jgi:hypothetical protein
MATEDMTPEDIKDLMRAASMMKANMENWKYVQHNAHLVERKQLEDTITQMISMFEPFVDGVQTALEIEALTKFDIIDLL